MSPVNEQIKETILDEVESMTISDFQNAIDKSGISGNTVIDEMVENLVEYLLNRGVYNDEVKREQGHDN